MAIGRGSVWALEWHRTAAGRVFIAARAWQRGAAIWVARAAQSAAFAAAEYAGGGERFAKRTFVSDHVCVIFGAAELR